MGESNTKSDGNVHLRSYNNWIRRRPKLAHQIKHKLRVGNIKVFTSIMSLYAKRMTDAEWDAFLADLSDVLTLHMNEPETDHEQRAALPGTGMQTTHDTNE